MMLCLFAICAWAAEQKAVERQARGVPSSTEAVQGWRAPCTATLPPAAATTAPTAPPRVAPPQSVHVQSVSVVDIEPVD